jgi:Holliday junction resolvasome RuvABC ATP-dependent DNA helicase subunit
MRVKIIDQTKALQLLNVAARSRSSVLFVGGPGRGKTTLAVSYLHRFGRPVTVRANAKGFYDVIASTREPVFIDEAHKLRDPEFLYPFLDDPGSWLRRKRVFALATTDQGDLPGPLVSRLINVALETYRIEDLMLIAKQESPRLSDMDLRYIAEVSRGSPRRAKTFARLVREARFNAPANQVLARLGFPAGFDAQERAYIEALKTGPKSLATLSGILGVGVPTVKRIESDMISSGLVQITSKGRVLVSLTKKPKLIVDEAKIESSGSSEFDEYYRQFKEGNW